MSATHTSGMTRDRARGALLGLAAGDAVGTTLEFERPGSFEPITDMVGGGPFDLAGAWGQFCHDVGLWALAGHGGLLIDTLDGQTVGAVSLNAGPLYPETELGWMLYAGHEGQGYATEAALAYRDWAFAVRGFATLVSNIDPANLASAAVARRLGARLDSAAARQDASDLVFRHLPGEGGA